MQVEEKKKRYYVLKHPFRAVLREWKYTPVLTRDSLDLPLPEIIRNREDIPLELPKLKKPPKPSFLKISGIEVRDHVLNFYYNEGLFNQFKFLSLPFEIQRTASKLVSVNRFYFGIKNRDEIMAIFERPRPEKRTEESFSQIDQGSQYHPPEIQTCFQILSKMSLKMKNRLESDYYSQLPKTAKT